MSLGDLEAFITEQEKLTTREPEREDSPVVRKFGGCLVDSLSGKHSREPGQNSARGIHCEILYSPCLISSVVRLPCWYMSHGMPKRVL